MVQVGETCWPKGSEERRNPWGTQRARVGLCRLSSMLGIRLTTTNALRRYRAQWVRLAPVHQESGPLRRKRILRSRVRDPYSHVHCCEVAGLMARASPRVGLASSTDDTLTGVWVKKAKCHRAYLAGRIFNERSRVPP